MCVSFSVVRVKGVGGGVPIALSLSSSLSIFSISFIHSYTHIGIQKKKASAFVARERYRGWKRERERVFSIVSLSFYFFSSWSILIWVSFYSVLTLSLHFLAVSGNLLNWVGSAFVTFSLFFFPELLSGEFLFFFFLVWFGFIAQEFIWVYSDSEWSTCFQWKLVEKIVFLR